MPYNNTTKGPAPNHGPSSPTTRLPLYLALAYTALIIYASLHPFSGWRDPGLSPFYFLTTTWPRYWTVFDLTINIFAYLPLGFLVTLILPPFSDHRKRWISALIAAMFGALLSFSLESLQTGLPSRVASNLDFASNTLGACTGALLALWKGHRLFDRIVLMQHHLLTPIHSAEPGMILIGLWLLTQLSPETILFGAGDLRQLLEIPPVVPYAAHSFFAIETGVIVCNSVAIGLITRTLLAGKIRSYAALAFFFVLALSIRTLAAAILINPYSAFTWLTPGAGLGLMFGGALLSLMLLLPASLRIALAGLALMAGTVLVNITPPNPYSAAALATWRQGHFLNFNGLTRLVASLWPFLALPYLIVLGRRL